MQKEHIVGIITILAGSLAIIFRSRLANNMIEFQNRVWGFNFGEREIKAGEIWLPIFGVCAIVFGLLFLFQIIQLRQ